MDPKLEQHLTEKGYKVVSGPISEDYRSGSCPRCGEELYGGSHYHCGNCTSTEVTSMLGHYYKDWDRTKGTFVGEHYFHCKPEEIKTDGPATR